MSKKPKSIYVVGSLRNRKIPKFANDLRALGFEAFDDWFSPGFEADEFWRKYEIGRGHNYKQALEGWAGKHIFEFDKHHIDRCDMGILVMPAGRSGHLEAGYMLGCGKKVYILFDKEPKRYDVMYQFATGVFFNKEDLFKELTKQKRKTKHANPTTRIPSSQSKKRTVAFSKRSSKGHTRRGNRHTIRKPSRVQNGTVFNTSASRR